MDEGLESPRVFIHNFNCVRMYSISIMSSVDFTQNSAYMFLFFEDSWYDLLKVLNKPETFFTDSVLVFIKTF